MRAFLLFLDKLPYSVRILLESAVRNCDNFQIKQQDVENILNWEQNQSVVGGIEVPFKPARVILQVKLLLLNRIIYYLLNIFLGFYRRTSCCRFCDYA